MLDNTEGVMKKDNPEKLATWDIQETRQIKSRDYRRGNEKDNPNKLAIQYIKDTGQINVRE